LAAVSPRSRARAQSDRRSTPVTAAGATIQADTSGLFTAQITVNGTETFSENGDSDSGGDGAAIFIGWSGGPITTIQFELTSASDDTANDFAIGAVSLETAVPEPSTWAMLLLGFAGLGFAGYRASRRTAVARAA